MSRKEARTDLWVATQLDECNIKFDPQGSSVMEIDAVLKSASKRGTGKIGYPEYVAVIDDYVLVIENKADVAKHLKLTDKSVIAEDTKSIIDYAVNGAYFYAKHIAQNSSFKKVFAVGVSGDGKHHKITPLYVDDRDGYKQLADLEAFISFSAENINEYYVRNVLEEPTDVEKTTEQILKDAAELHEYLRTYGALKDQDKPLVVSGILLALDEIEYGGFSLDSLTGDNTAGMHDGNKLLNAIKGRLTRSNVGPDAKKDKLIHEFAILQTSFRLNEVHTTLAKTPLKFFSEFLYERVFKSIKYQASSEDFIGRFYGEFMSYSGGDGQTLGIILTPRHITDLMCELVDIKADDVVLDPCCGTAGFLISAMHQMLSMTTDKQQRMNIKKKQLHGFEIQSNMFAVAATNMILRRDGNSNLECSDFLAKNPNQVQMKGATVGLMNPPYSQGTKSAPSQYELSFVERLLNSLVKGARCAVIVPQSSMTGKSKIEQALKNSIMKRHTLEGVITCNPDTFYGVGTNPAIAVFTAHEPHDVDKICKFIDFREDGYKVRAHIGLVEGDTAKDRKKHLLDVWRGSVEAPSKFCVKSTVTAEDEWLHSFYYFNDDIPTDADFEKSIGDYLTFEFSMIMQNRKYLFKQGDDNEKNAYAAARIAELGKVVNIPSFDEKNWKSFALPSIFDTIQRGKRWKNADHVCGDVPYVSSTANNNGVAAYIETSAVTRVFKNCISLANSGSVGSSFYQPYEFVASDHITHLKNVNFSKYIYLFMTSMIEKQKSNFNFNREINDLRIKNMQIMLPVDEKEKPDYVYMEQYAKNTMIKKYKQYLTFLDNKYGVES